MRVSLVEMAVAIALAGLIFAGALIPVTQTVHAYQECEASAQRSSAHYLATLRVKQLAGSIWRQGDPPAGHDAMKDSSSSRVAVGDWEISAAHGSVLQRWKGQKAAVLAQPAETFSLRYLLDDGSWKSAVKETALAQVIAVRYQWTDSDSGYVCRGVALPTDKTFAGLSIILPESTSPSEEHYRRSDYERTIRLELKDWQ